VQASTDNTICDAVEASYYVSPERPGLTADELQRCLISLGFDRDEIVASISRLSDSTLAATPTGYIFRPDAVPDFLQQITVTFEGDPRDWATFAYVHGLLSDTAREKGARNASMSLGSIIARGTASGHRVDQLRLAIYGLAWMNLTSVAAGIVTATDRTLTTSVEAVEQTVRPRLARPGFTRTLKVVREVVEGRGEDAQWRRLVRDFELLPRPDHLKAAEESVLDDICAQFAESGEPSHLDDALRRMPDLDVRTIAYANLEPKGYLHTLPDTRVLPSLVALLHLYPLFPQLLLASNTLLGSARERWENKVIRAPFSGPSGLIPATRPEASQRLALRQLRALIDAQSFGPCLYAAGDALEIRDDVRLYDTLPKLLALKIRPASTTARKPPPAYETFLRSVLHEASNAPGRTVSLRSLAGVAGLPLDVASRLLVQARADNVLTGSTRDALEPNAAAAIDVLSRLARNEGTRPSDRPSADASPALATSLADRLQRWLHAHTDGGQSVPGIFALGTQTGSRRNENQDRAVFARLSTPKREPFELAVVCDGIGGLKGGEQGAEIAVAAFVSAVFSHQANSSVDQLLLSAAREANARVHSALLGRGGTTLSAFLLRGKRAFACNIGDGRVYTVDADGILTQATTDDTMKGRLDALGVARDSSAFEHERLVQYIGMGEDLQPQIVPIDIDRTHAVLLASDGAYRPSLPLLAELFRAGSSPDDLVHRLLAISSWTGGNDNATVVAVALPHTRPIEVGIPHHGALEVWGPRAQVEFLSVPVATATVSPSESLKRTGRTKRPRGRRDEQLTIVAPPIHASTDEHVVIVPAKSRLSGEPPVDTEVEITVGTKRGPDR
jgi:serine/threonine protein phosphatase PrpC